MTPDEITKLCRQAAVLIARDSAGLPECGNDALRVIAQEAAKAGTPTPREVADIYLEALADEIASRVFESMGLTARHR